MRFLDIGMKTGHSILAARELCIHSIDLFQGFSGKIIKLEKRILFKAITEDFLEGHVDGHYLLDILRVNLSR